VKSARVDIICFPKIVEITHIVMSEEDGGRLENTWTHPYVESRPVKIVERELQTDESTADTKKENEGKEEKKEEGEKKQKERDAKESISPLNPTQNQAH